MKTISLPYYCSDEDMNFIKDEICKSSNMVRYAYNRFQDGKSEKDIRALAHTLKNIPFDSWFVQCAIKKADYINKANKDKVIFGGKFNFFQRLQKKISKEDYKQKRLLAIYSQGEKLNKGNRKFALDMVNNQIIFKFSAKKKILLKLPNLHKNYMSDLVSLQTLAENKNIAFSVELGLKNINVSFEDSLLNCNIYKGKENIVAGIDMNPNYIGFSISKFTDDKRKVLLQEQYDLTSFTKNLHKASNDKDNKHQNNKQIHELKEIAKQIIEKCKHFKVGKFGIEDLSFKAVDSGKGKRFNRLTKNKWKRDALVSALKKQCLLTGIDFIEVNPAYSSIIGNLMNNTSDPIASSLEVARRAMFKYIKGKFYPELIKKEDLLNRWKESASWVYKSWKELFDIVKTAGVKYRRSLDSFEYKVFRLMTPKSNVILYKFYNDLD